MSDFRPSNQEPVDIMFFFLTGIHLQHETLKLLFEANISSSFHISLRTRIFINSETGAPLPLKLRTHLRLYFLLLEQRNRCVSNKLNEELLHF